MVEIWVTNAPIMLLPLALMGSSLATMSPHVGFGTLLTLMDVSIGATISANHLTDFRTFGQTLLLSIWTEFSIGNFFCVFFVFSALLTCVLVMYLICSHPFAFPFADSLLSQQVMDRLFSSASTASSIDDYSKHNMWNPLLELLFLKHVNDIFDPYLVNLDLAQIALSCHFAHNLLCSKEEVLVSAQ